MNNPKSQPVTGHDDPGHPVKKVRVTVDQKNHEVRPGDWLVSEFKHEVKVDAAKALDQLIDGQLTPLSDDATIVIRGGEQFVSHARQGGSS